MYIPKKILRFFGLFCLSYFLLYFFLSLPAVFNAQMQFLKASGKTVTKNFLPKAYFDIDVREKPEQETAAQFFLIFANQKEVDKALAESRRKGRQAVQLDVRQRGLYIERFWVLPLAFLLSLVLLTPVHWQKKLTGLSVCLGIFLIYELFRLFIYAFNYIAAERIGIYELDGFTFEFVNMLYENLAIGSTLILLTFLWVAVFFKKSDWRKMLVRMGGTAAV